MLSLHPANDYTCLRASALKRGNGRSEIKKWRLGSAKLAMQGGAAGFNTVKGEKLARAK